MIECVPDWTLEGAFIYVSNEILLLHLSWPETRHLSCRLTGSAIYLAKSQVRRSFGESSLMLH